MRIIVLDSEERRVRVISALTRMPLDPILQVTIEEYDPKRSGQANRRYWKLLQEASKKCGHHVDELHDFFKEKFLGSRVIEIAGERATVRPSSRRLGVKAFKAYMDQVEQFLIEKLGVWLDG